MKSKKILENPITQPMQGKKLLSLRATTPFPEHSPYDKSSENTQK